MIAVTVLGIIALAFCIGACCYMAGVFDERGQLNSRVRFLLTLAVISFFGVTALVIWLASHSH